MPVDRYAHRNPCLRRPGEVSELPGGRARGMHARLSGAPQAGTCGERDPSVAVRGNADDAHRPPQLCTPTVLPARSPFAIRPWTAPLNWSKPIGARSQHGFSTWSGNDRE
jgi:hypothetical protein